jgi:hypothetical protein
MRPLDDDRVGRANSSWFKAGSQAEFVNHPRGNSRNTPTTELFESASLIFGDGREAGLIEGVALIAAAGRPSRIKDTPQFFNSSLAKT